jgi:hypothetical protein
MDDIALLLIEAGADIHALDLVYTSEFQILSLSKVLNIVKKRRGVYMFLGCVFIFLFFSIILLFFACTKTFPLC